MIRRIVSVALHQPLFVVMLLVLFIAAGLAAFRTLPVEAFPDVTDVQVTVITLFPGHAPEEVEKQITIPLEVGLSGLPNAVRMFSLDALSEATNTFDRISALRDLSYADEKLFRDLNEALEFLTLLRLQRQAEQSRDGKPFSNFINPDSLSHLQRSLLKEAFAAVTHAQSLVQSKFESWVWQHMR